MAQHRRKFSPQFKAEAVQFVIGTGRPIAEIAREPAINERTLGNWVNDWKQSTPEPERDDPAQPNPGATYPRAHMAYG